MIEAIVRFVLVATGLLGGYVIARTAGWQTELGLDRNYVIFLLITLGGASGFVLGGILGRELASLWKRTEERIARVAAVDLLLGVAGLVLGLLIAFFVAQPLRYLQPAWFALSATLVLTVTSAYLSIAVALTRRQDVIRLLPGLATAGEPGRASLTVLDTSAVIDGRFVELRSSGFLTGDVRVPRFVLAELQTLADSADDTKRARGRRGLDLLATLPVDRAVEVLEVDYIDEPAVDSKLITLASDTDAVIVTVDYNLTQVARVSGATVLNLNEAAAALRPTFLPGDGMFLRVVKQGKEAGQGVGYLEDGTMVVVQDGRGLIGLDAEVEVTSVLQTAAGRMIFARPVQAEPSGQEL